MCNTSNEFPNRLRHEEDKCIIRYVWIHFYSVRPRVRSHDMSVRSSTASATRQEKRPGFNHLSITLLNVQVHSFFFFFFGLYCPGLFPLPPLIPFPNKHFFRCWKSWRGVKTGTRVHRGIGTWQQIFHITRTSWRSAPLVLVPVPPNVSHNPSC